MRNTNPKHAYLLKVHPETRIKPQVLISDVKDLNPKELEWMLLGGLHMLPGIHGEIQVGQMALRSHQ